MPSCTCRTSSRCSSTSSRCRRHPTPCDCLLCRRPFSDVDRRAPAAGPLAGRRSEVVEQVTLESVHAEKPQCGARPRHASSMRAVTLGSWGPDRGIRLPVPRADRPHLRGLRPAGDRRKREPEPVRPAHPRSLSLNRWSQSTYQPAMTHKDCLEDGASNAPCESATAISRSWTGLSFIAMELVGEPGFEPGTWRV